MQPETNSHSATLFTFGTDAPLPTDLDCPNAACPSHHDHLPRWIVRDGTRFGKPDGCGVMPRDQRYVCKHCGTIVYGNHNSPTFYQHTLFDLSSVAAAWIEGTSIRGMARMFHVAPSTIQRKLDILGRNSLAILSLIERQGQVDEELVVDGFESFVVSQYFPTNTNIVVGKRSQLVYGFNHVVMRRKGRMTDLQKRRRAEIDRREKPDSMEFPRRFEALVNGIVAYAQRSQRPVTLWSDEHPVYARVIGRMDDARRWICHRRVSSLIRRDKRNELFSVNYMEREIRKDMAEHHRETVCFARNVNTSMHRFAVYIVMHNFFKPYRVGTNDSRSHAAVAGCWDRSETEVRQLLFERRARVDSVQGFYREVFLKTLHTPLSQTIQTVPAYTYA